MQRVPGRINPRRNMLRNTVIKQTKVKTMKNIKSNKRKVTNNIQGNSHKVINWLLNRNSTSQKRMAWYIYSDDREEPTTKNTLPSKTLLQIWWRNQNLSRQRDVKRIQHHQTSFTTNAKRTSLGRKHKRRKRSTENKAKTIKKMEIGSYISTITLNVIELNAPTKKHRLAG